MTVIELAQILDLFYNEGLKRKESNAFIQMFGIRYAKEISDSNVDVKDIIEKSTLKESYSSEIYKGIKLSKYVDFKENILF